ncbi:probable enoyl-CoA hydratase 2, mitochondrial [Arachis stenosperma]|uniref:probable enoyl-CoA hydratase 2, mitochondrial n=1 Tax=Arachis stenosperma TaxID=217475 RepID=UPI0025AD3F96|nr:probable enoyl-CoA hydratase 2, mitochondrial [Arachis stenosperma]
MGALRVLMKRSLSTSKPYLTPNHPSLTFAILHQYHNRRNLFLHHSASDFVKFHKLSATDSGIVEVSLDRPGAKNAIGKEMLRGLTRAFEFINQESNVNVAMICSSVPGVFCAGADLKERRNMSQSEVKVFVNSLRSAFLYLEKVCIPTIAVIEGVALGGGLEMALACDIRICGENALMGLPETGLAIIPGAGGTQRLPRLVGNAIAKEIIYTGREINGKEALSLGLVNYFVPAGEAYSKALAVAREINAKGPVAIRMAKRAISEGVDTDMRSGLALEEDCYDQVLNTKDRLEGLAAFAEKRKPKYTGE